jgi:hypothetical protein
LEISWDKLLNFEGLNLRHSVTDQIGQSCEVPVSSPEIQLLNGRKHFCTDRRMRSVVGILLLSLLLTVPAFSVELFRYRGAASDGLAVQQKRKREKIANVL